MFAAAPQSRQPRKEDAEERLRAEMHAARLEFADAACKYKMLIAVSDPAGATPEALHALHRAKVRHESAFRRYTEALDSFTDFILPGREPRQKRD